MINTLIKIFVKNHENVDDQIVRANYGKLAGLVGIITNILLFAIKFAIGTIFSSLSIVADAMNNLSDSASSVVTLVGFKLSSKPADKEHPYGHARIEYICGIIVSFIVILIGIELAGTSFDKILNPQMPRFSMVVFVSLIISCLIKLWQSFFYKKIADKINSQTIKATSADSRNDCLSTLVVFLGMLIMYFSNVNIDGYLGFLLAIFIIYSGVKLVVETSAPLLGEAPHDELVEQIKTKIMSYNGVLGIHDLMYHSYGAGKVFASIHCEVDSRADINESHNLMDNIERDFTDSMGISMVLHMDPVDISDPKSVALKKIISNKIAIKFKNTSIHDFRVVWGIDHSNIVFDISVPFSEKSNDDDILAEVTKMVSEIDATYLTKAVIDRVSL